VTGCLERRLYNVEKVIYESRPGLPVTANLYIPRQGTGPFPCVLGACGHSQVGKAEPFYQSFAQGLATKGYVVLVYDPISQGERLQYLNLEESARPRGCCEEHNMMGNQMGLASEFLGAWRVWDGMRSLDYLLSRPEVDASRVGVTGNSGGGTLSTYLNAFDDRFTMAAPSCFVTTYLRNLENELPADSEQIPPGILGLGLDMADFFIAQIPRPVLLLGQDNDFFDRRGLRATYAQLQRLYSILGAGDDIQLFVGPADHGFTVHNRQAMYGFFSQHAQVDAGTQEPEVALESPEDLAATPTGQVHGLGCRRVFDLTRRTATRLAGRRRPVQSGELPAVVTRVLALPERGSPPHYRVLRGRGQDSGVRFARHSSFAVETEAGIQAILHLFGGKEYYHLPVRGRAVLAVPHVSSQQDIAAGLFPVEEEVWVVDVRGIGQSTALTCADANFFAPYGSDYLYASHGLMLGEPYLGRRVHDLLAALDLLQAEGWGPVHLMGRGLGSLTAAFAAVLHPQVGQVTLWNALLSYHELTQVPVQRWPLSAMAPGVLKHVDLPDCYRALAAKGLFLVDPWTSQMTPWDPAALGAHLHSLGLSPDLVRS
jgi:dienelactone hydrolase